MLNFSYHSSAAYIASLSLSGLGSVDNHHLVQSVIGFNSLVSPPDSISVESFLASSIPQRILSQRLNDHSFGLLVGAAEADKQPHGSAVHSVDLGLHFDPNELQIAVK